MPRCTTCALLIKEPWEHFTARVGGSDKAEAFQVAAAFDESIGGPLGIAAVYCFGEEPQFVKQLGTNLHVKEWEPHEIFSEEHDCKFHQLASGHVPLDAAINQYQHLRQASNMETTNINIIDNSGIININSTITEATQNIQSAPALNTEVKSEIITLFEELNKHLSKVPAGHEEEAEIVADQVKAISEELKRGEPRQPMLKINGKGLIEAAKAIAKVLPEAIPLANKISEFVTNSVG